MRTAPDESTRRAVRFFARVARGDRGSSCSRGGDGICEVGEGGYFRLDRVTPCFNDSTANIAHQSTQNALPGAATNLQADR